MGSNPLDDSIDKAIAMVIDGNEISRRTLAAMLREFGVGRVDQIERTQDVRQALVNRNYDIVLCDSHFQGEVTTGPELMDEMRQAGLLPLSAVVVMISGEGEHGQVAEAAEIALDAYLLKPHTMDALRVRLLAARDRKRALAEVITLVGEQRFAEAASAADALANARGVAWLSAARIGADVYLRLGKPQESQRLLEQVLQAGAMPWARLGLARAQSEAGADNTAKRTLEGLINDLPGFADAYDVMGRVLLEQGDTAAAIVTLRKAAELTPNKVARLVKLGLMTFYFGDAREASETLTRAVRLGVHSKAFDPQGLLLLAALQFDRRDQRGLAMSVQMMARMRQGEAASARLRRFEACLVVLQALLEHRPVDAMAALNPALGEMREPDFEFEAASNLLMVLARLDANELHLANLDEHIAALTRRFAVSRTTCDLLCATLGAQAERVAVVRGCYEEVCATVEQAVARTLAGEPRAAAQALLAAAEKTLNAKLMNLALQTLERHKDKISDATSLLDSVRALVATYSSAGPQVWPARVDELRALPAQSPPQPG